MNFQTYYAPKFRYYFSSDVYVRHILVYYRIQKKKKKKKRRKEKKRKKKKEERKERYSINVKDHGRHGS